MIYEHRTYQIQAGKAGEFLKIYEAEGLGIITRYAKLIGCWTKETGVLNSVVFIWAYDDFAPGALARGPGRKPDRGEPRARGRGANPRGRRRPRTDSRPGA
jgi:hypothetical protein